MADLASGAAWRRRQHGCLRRWNLRGEAEEGATTPIVVVTRAADGGCGAGYSDPPFALQGGHCVRRPKCARRKSPAPGWDLSSTMNFPRTMAGPPGESGQRHSWSPGRRRSCCGTPASGSSWSKLSMLLCCRRWSSCRTSCSSLPRSYWWLPSRLSKCRRSCLMMLLCDIPVATRSWRNSWWKYRRPYSTLRYFSGLWSSTSTFQFLLVEGETFVFKVFSQNRVQPFRFLPQNAFLSGLWSRSLTSPLLVEILKVFAQDRVHPQLRTLQLLGSTLRMGHFKGFSHFFPGRKKCD